MTVVATYYTETNLSGLNLYAFVDNVEYKIEIPNPVSYTQQGAPLPELWVEVSIRRACNIAGGIIAKRLIEEYNQPATLEGQVNGNPTQSAN